MCANTIRLKRSRQRVFVQKSAYRLIFEGTYVQEGLFQKNFTSAKSIAHDIKTCDFR